MRVQIGFRGVESCLGVELSERAKGYDKFSETDGAGKPLWSDSCRTKISLVVGGCPMRDTRTVHSPWRTEKPMRMILQLRPKGLFNNGIHRRRLRVKD